VQPWILLTIIMVNNGHNIMIYGFSTWIQSYISNITQRIFFHGSLYNFKHVGCGVLQGSSLGPLLFSIFTNDLPLALNKARVSMNADDSTINVLATCHTLTLDISVFYIFWLSRGGTRVCTLGFFVCLGFL
jgi:hypothetical protein